MFSNYLKIAFRSLFRQKGYSLLNILGLSVGLTVSLLILLWVQDELRMDRFHADGERIHRLLVNLDMGESGIATWTTTPYPLIELIRESLPDVEDIGAYDPTNKKQFEVDGKEFLEDGIFATDGFFRVMTFPFVEGKRRAVFNEPNVVAISERLAAKLFGHDWRGQTVGEMVSINGQDHKVTGVFADVSKHSSLSFDFALDLASQHVDDGQGFPWGNFDSRTVLKLKEGISAAQFAPKVANLINENNQYADGTEIFLQPYERKYLHGQFENGKEAGGRIEYVQLFGLAALFLLLIACINFMNLATARAAKRAKEVGVRKTVGAGRGSLIAQFMIEAAVITFFSVLIAVLLGEMLLPYFREISAKQLVFDYGRIGFWTIIVSVGLVTSLLAGSYPSFFLSSFRTINVLKGKISYHLGGGSLRKGLVVFQFVLSALLVVCAMVVQNQVNFIKTKHLGLDKENVLYFRTPPGADDNLDVYKNELLRTPGIEELTFAQTNPLSVGSQTGDPKWDGMAPDEGLLFNVIITDDNFLNTMNIPLVAGRDFEEFLSTDTMSFLINETAAKAMKLKEPLGNNLEFWGVKGPIVGVVKDFHISSLHETIGPLIIANMPEETGLTMMRIDPSRTEAVIAAAQTIFEKNANGFPFRYDFLDDRYEQMYRSEERTSNLSGWFALVALFISCLGLLGLSAFVAEQKTKEIGIRKVLGASVVGIVAMLSKDFLKLVALALLIALPLGWYLMNNWLTNFAYQVELGWWVFAMAGGLAVLVALLTVGFQSAKAALANPVNSLRSE
ncbi:MAG: ABC transporter permease [Bacteroidota bacterium]